MQSTNKKEDVKFLKEENENENVEKNLDENNLKKIKEIDENEKLLENEYIPYKKYINKTKLFIILFSFGIILSLISSCICFFLELNSNQDTIDAYISMKFYNKKVGDIVEVQVIEVDIKKQRIGLTMKIKAQK